MTSDATPAPRQDDAPADAGCGAAVITPWAVDEPTAPRQDEPQPVAWRSRTTNNLGWAYLTNYNSDMRMSGEWEPLYTRPAPRQDDTVAALSEAMAQLLDDMGVDGKSVCGMAKAQARIAYEPWHTAGEDGVLYTLEAARQVIADVEAGQIGATPTPRQDDEIAQLRAELASAHESAVYWKSLSGRHEERIARLRAEAATLTAAAQAMGDAWGWDNGLELKALRAVLTNLGKAS